MAIIGQGRHRYSEPGAKRQNFRPLVDDVFSGGESRRDVGFRFMATGEVDYADGRMARACR